MFQSRSRTNKTIYYFFVILFLISVIVFWGVFPPNILNADDKIKDKIEEKENKEEYKENKKEDKEERKEDKEEIKEDKEEDKEEKKEDKEEKDKDKSLKIYHITASCNHGGSISPKGSQDINSGESLTFNCTADEGYDLIYLRVDNEKIEEITSYTFTDVDANHTIHASFKKVKDPISGPAGEDDYGDEDSNNDFLYDYNNNLIVLCSSLSFFTNVKSSDIEENSTGNRENNSNHTKSEKIEKSYDKKYLFDTIEINDTNQLLDINAIIEKNEITEILDVDDIINEGNFIETGQLDLNTDNPFISTFIFVWDKIKDFSYYYNT
jgi:Rieske Fe-S protein